MESTSFNDFINIMTRDWINPSDGSTSFPQERAYPGHLRCGQSTGIHGVLASLYHIFKEEDKDILFTSAYPDLILSHENKPGTITEPTHKIPNIVTFKIIRVSPDFRGGSPQGPRAEWKVRPREENVGVDENDNLISTAGQRFACSVQFDCWSNTRFECELLSEYLQELIRKYTGLLMTLGATRVIFKERLEDETLEKFHLPVVTLRYHMEVEKIYLMRTPRIEEIRTRIKLLT